MTDHNDNPYRSGLAFGWIDEREPGPSARRYWVAAATLVLLIGAVAYAIAWWFR